MFKRNELAKVIAVACSTLVLSGCLVEGDATTSNTITEDSQRLDVSEIGTQTAAVVGLVQDTNGNAIAGASVSLAGKTTITDGNGTYVFNSVAVTGFSEGGDYGDELSVVITPPPASGDEAGYVSATVTVNPQAQVLVNEAGESYSNGSNTENTLLSVIIIDGLTISAGAAVLPQLQATVEGVLRDEETGLIIPNVAVGLELRSAGSSRRNQEQSIDNDNVSYGVESYIATTDAEGKFRFENLPNDSEFDIVVAGYGYIDGIEYNGDAYNYDISTHREVALLNLGDVYVDPIHSEDYVSPTIEGVIGGFADYNDYSLSLKKGIDGTQGITVEFSEALADTIGHDSVFLIDTTEQVMIELASVALSTDKKSLIVTTSAPLAEGHDFDLHLSKYDVTDTSENLLVEENGKRWYDVDYRSGPMGVETIRIDIQSYAAPVIGSDAIAITRIENDTSSSLSPYQEIQAHNAAFVDALADGAPVIEQLNSSDADDRLEELNNQSVGDSGLGYPVYEVQTDVVRLSFNATDSSVYLVSITDESGNPKNASIDVLTDGVEMGGGPARAPGYYDQVIYSEDDISGTQVEFIIEGVTANDQVTITPMTDFFTPIDASKGQIALTDNVAATTVLQRSYGLGNETSGTVDVAYGNGGELSGPDAAAYGTPLFAVTPYLLVPQATNAPVPLDRDTIWDALVENNEVYLNGETKVSFENINYRYFGYDSAAFALYAPGSRVVGVAFSEDVSVTGAPVYSGSASLTEFTAVNDVAINDQGSSSVDYTDLVQFKVDSVLKLADDNGAILDFTDAVTDSSANVSTVAYNAKVVIEDRMPAFVTEAVYTGDEVVLTFNEKVSIKEGDSFTLDGLQSYDYFNFQATMQDELNNFETTSVTLDLTKDTLNQSGELVTRERQAFDWSEVFNRSTGTGEDVVANSALYFRDVEDLNGNKWDDYFGSDILIPVIAITNELNEFAVLAKNPAETGYEVGSNLVTYVLNSSHPFDLRAEGAVAGAQSLDANQVASIFSISGTSLDTPVIDVALNTRTGATLSSDGKVLTVTLELIGTLQVDDVLNVNMSVQSAWDEAGSSLYSVTHPALLAPEAP